MADRFDGELDALLNKARLDEEKLVKALDLPSWYRNPALWEQVLLNGESFFCEPLSVSKENRFDPKKAKGRDGANVTHTGVLPIQGQIKLKIWTGTDERRWESLAPEIDPQRVVTVAKQVKEKHLRAGAFGGFTVAESTKTQTTKTMPQVKVAFPLLTRHQVYQVYITKTEERLDVEMGMLLVTLHYVKAGAGKDGATATPKKQTDIVLPNAFDRTSDVRATLPDPAKETKL